MLLPLPLSPTSATISRWLIVRSTSSTACRTSLENMPPTRKWRLSPLPRNSGQRRSAVSTGLACCGAPQLPADATGARSRIGELGPRCTADTSPAAPAVVELGPGPAMIHRDRTAGWKRSRAADRARSGGEPGIPRSWLRGPYARESLDQPAAVRVLRILEDLSRSSPPRPPVRHTSPARDPSNG